MFGTAAGNAKLPRRFSRFRPGPLCLLPDNTALGRKRNVSVNGARVTQNDFEINGIDANNLATNAMSLVAVPAPESIQEFKVQTSLYAAIYGRGGGGNIQAVTKSGSNNFHGAAYEYFRHDVLNANDPLLKAAISPKLRRNVSGGLLGGPIKADKLFFFGSYQGTREENGASLKDSRPASDRARFDQRSFSSDSADHIPAQSLATPATSINPVGLALLNARLPDGQFLIPTPQADGAYFRLCNILLSRDQFVNVDYRINERDWLALDSFSRMRRSFSRFLLAAQMFRLRRRSKSRTTG